MKVAMEKAKMSGGGYVLIKLYLLKRNVVDQNLPVDHSMLTFVLYSFCHC